MYNAAKTAVKLSDRLNGRLHGSTRAAGKATRGRNVVVNALLLLVSVSILSSCGDVSTQSFEREELFRLSIGKLEDHLDLFRVGGIPLDRKTRLFSRGGRVFISNGPSNKIMEFTSYGDLIHMLYDPEDNPRPVMLLATPGSEARANRHAHEYSFHQLGDIVVTGEELILVEEILSPDRALLDPETGVILNRVVLRFSSDGERIDYLGQEGIGGAPFPYIERLEVTNTDEVVVVSRTQQSWKVFWFSSDMDLLYDVTIPLDSLPVPRAGVVPFLDTVVPDKEAHVVYVKLSYFDDTQGAAEETPSRIYNLSLETGRYEGFFEVPRNIRTVFADNEEGSRDEEFLYELVGSAPRGHLILMSRELDDQTLLLVVDNEGSVVRRRRITIEDSDIVYKHFHISPEGILYGLLAWEDHARVVWWRSDRLIPAGGSS